MDKIKEMIIEVVEKYIRDNCYALYEYTINRNGFKREISNILTPLLSHIALIHLAENGYLDEKNINHWKGEVVAFMFGACDKVLSFGNNKYKARIKVVNEVFSENFDTDEQLFNRCAAKLTEEGIDPLLYYDEVVGRIKSELPNIADAIANGNYAYIQKYATNL